ncbi:MAG: hypothetical protein L6Q38_17920 [Nitrospira sp.]|nr:hypothetical protein [Nitrospira sp.]
MMFILPTSRQRFTEADFRFITRHLATTDSQGKALMELLSDTECRDQVLDEEQLVHALLDSPECSGISEHCYFYLLVRHAFRRAGIDDRRLADYVAGVLAGFVRDEPSAVPRDSEGRPMRYVFEMLAALQHADDRTRFYLQAYLGNHTLFITGLFPGRIERQRERRGAPGIRYYEGMGRSSFRAASDHRLAERYDLDRVLAQLSEAFGEVRLALNDLCQRVVWIGEPLRDPGSSCN